MYVAIRLCAEFSKICIFRGLWLLLPTSCPCLFLLVRKCQFFFRELPLSPSIQFWRIINKDVLCSPGRGVVQACPTICFLLIIGISMWIQGLNLDRSSLPLSRYPGIPWFLTFWAFKCQLFKPARISICCLPSKNPDCVNPPLCLHPSWSSTLYKSLDAT